MTEAPKNNAAVMVAIDLRTFPPNIDSRPPESKHLHLKTRGRSSLVCGSRQTTGESEEEHSQT